MIGQTYANKLDTLRFLCEYIIDLRKQIADLRAELEQTKTDVAMVIHLNNEESREAILSLRGELAKVKETVGLAIYNDSEEAKEELQAVKELIAAKK